MKHAGTVSSLGKIQTCVLISHFLPQVTHMMEAPYCCTSGASGITPAQYAGSPCQQYTYRSPYFDLRCDTTSHSRSPRPPHGSSGPAGSEQCVIVRACVWAHCTCRCSVWRWGRERRMKAWLIRDRNETKHESTADGRWCKPATRASR